MIRAENEAKAVNQKQTGNRQYIQDKRMNFRYPIFLDLTGKRCLVIGDGREIPAKAKALMEAGADVRQMKAREFKDADLAGCFLVITEQKDNSEIFRLAEERGILCNAVDDPANCRFIFGSIHRQGDLTISVSTNGRAPALAVRIKQQLEREIGPEYGALLELLKEVRPDITNRLPDFSARRELWYRIVDSDVLDLLRAGKRDGAVQAIRGMVEEAVASTVLHRQNNAMANSSDLQCQPLVAFIATRNPDQARQFYADRLGLPLTSNELPFALVFDANGIMLRVTVVNELTAAPYTVLGWSVRDIEGSVKSLQERGVRFERYPNMNQDELGIWTAPGGTRVAWFRDPDGNTLSLSQH
jgi:siroheme synthase-like protein